MAILASTGLKTQKKTSSGARPDARVITGLRVQHQTNSAKQAFSISVYVVMLY